MHCTTRTLGRSAPEAIAYSLPSPVSSKAPAFAESLLSGSSCLLEPHGRTSDNKSILHEWLRVRIRAQAPSWGLRTMLPDYAARAGTRALIQSDRASSQLPTV